MDGTKADTRSYISVKFARHGIVVWDQLIRFQFHLCYSHERFDPCFAGALLNLFNGVPARCGKRSF